MLLLLGHLQAISSMTGVQVYGDIERLGKDSCAAELCDSVQVPMSYEKVVQSEIALNTYFALWWYIFGDK